MRTGRSVVVRINDRGPFIRGRVIDLTPAGARAIGSSGLAAVTLIVLSARTRRPAVRAVLSRADQASGQADVAQPDLSRL